MERGINVKMFYNYHNKYPFEIGFVYDMMIMSIPTNISVRFSCLSVQKTIRPCLGNITEVNMDKFIITISREFGSGGRLIGEKLAARLGVEFYDRSIIQMAAEKSGLSYKFIEQNEENVTNSLIFNISAASSFTQAMTYFDTPVNDKTFFAQAEVIRELAKNSCVIVGRCADYILREDPALVRLFITADLDDRARRAVEEYQYPSVTAAEKIRKIDKSRANYYKYYTGQPWGNLHNYDLIINTSFTGILGAVSVIMTMLEEKGVQGKAF